MKQVSIHDLTPTEFEKWCCAFLDAYAEEENLPDFKIVHNKIFKVSDGRYQIDIFAEFTAMKSKIKILCECKKYKNRVNREKVAILHRKLESIGAHKGILISTSDFQSGAIEYAKVHGIALIKAEDYHFEYLCHSSGRQNNNEDDPFCYAERHMPPYSAFDCTASLDEPRKVYPTRAFIRKLLIEQNLRICERLGINVDIDFQET